MMLSRALLVCTVFALSIAYKTYVNVAQGRNATQSSMGWSGVAEKAVDGKTSGKYWEGSCTHTNNEGVAWWEVDLGHVYNISYILVYGRTDCCSDRIEGAKLWIGNNKCTTLKDQGSDQVERVTCDNPAHMVGRRLKIETLNPLTLCEVEVMVDVDVKLDSEMTTDTPDHQRFENHGEVVNVAFNKMTTQSSTKHDGWSKRGVDGYSNTKWSDKSCSYTDNDGMNYWEVDLGRVYNIDHIKLFGRSDSGQTWLNGATVKVGGRLCEMLADMEIETEQGKVIQCTANTGDMVGRKVRVEKWVTDIVICELQVFVKPDAIPDDDAIIPTEDYGVIGQEVDGFYNVAKGKNTSASSEPWGGAPGRAVDGVTNQNWHLKSCTHTNNRGNEWWKVDLGRFYQIDHIRIWGRTDQHQDRLEGARLWIGEHRCGTLKSMGKEAKADVISCTRAESAGRYVTIENMGEYITLCEVQIMVKKSDVELLPDVVASHGEKKGDYTNVALKKSTTQTTVQSNGWSENGVDGWALTKYSSGSCTHTRNSGLQQYTIDLGNVYKVDHIKIWGRSDCCEDWIKYARVYVGRWLCGSITEDMVKEDTPGPFTIQCSTTDTEISGQFVKIDRINEYLSICEAEVMVKNEDLIDDEVPSTFPRYENVALFKPTNQSSEGWNGVSSRATDGHTNTEYRKLSCTHSLKDALSWWEVDLETHYNIDSLIIYGRGDCCNDRINGAVITVDGKTVSSIMYTYDDQTRWDIDLGNVWGRKIRVSLLDQYLTLCEVQAMVDHDYDPSTDPDVVDPSLMNLAAGKPAFSSSVWLGGVASNANDGNTEGNFYRGSCSSTGPTQGTHWWEVHLEEDYNVGHVLLYPRLDLNKPDYIDKARVTVDEELCGIIEWVQDRTFFRIDCHGKTGSKVTVTHEGGYLQLCEVVVQAAEN